MNARAGAAVSAKVIALPVARRRLSEASIVPIARTVTAIVFDVPGEAGRSRPRLTALFDGQPMGGPQISTSLELRSGARRYVLVVGRSAEQLTGTTVTLALGAQLAAILDGDWLQPPLADGTSLVRGLTEAGRRRLLKLFMTTGASLFGRGSAEFAAAAHQLAEVTAAVSLMPATSCPAGAGGDIVSYRMPVAAGEPDVQEMIALGAGRVARLTGWSHFVEEGERGRILHLFLPAAARGAEALVCLGEVQTLLRAPDAEARPSALVPWLARRDGSVRAWVETLLEPAAADDPAAAALMRELRQEAGAAPKAELRHVSTTPGGLLIAADLADPDGLARAWRIERGAAVEEIAASARLACFVPLPAACSGPDIHRISLVHHSGRISVLGGGVAQAYAGQMPEGFAGAAAAVAAARLDLPALCAIEAPAPSGEPLLAIIAGVSPNLDLIRARAAFVFAEPRGRGVEMIYHARAGGLAEAARGAMAQAEAVYGIPHRLVVLPDGATESDALLAAIRAVAAPRLLCLGAEVLPAGPGWLAAWLSRPDEARPVVGGALVDIGGSVLHAGGRLVETATGAGPDMQIRGAGWPARDLPRSSAETDLVSADCVAMTLAAAQALAAAARYPNPDVMLAAMVQGLRQEGREARILLQSRFVRYSAAPRQAALAREVDAAALAALLKPFFRPGAEEGHP